MDLLITLDLLEQIGGAGLLEGQVVDLRRTPALIWNGIDV